MQEFSCKDCAHFHQHYVPYKDRFMEAYCGHCVRPRVKHRKPDTPACGHFVRKEKNNTEAELKKIKSG